MKANRNKKVLYDFIDLVMPINLFNSVDFMFSFLYQNRKAFNQFKRFSFTSSSFDFIVIDNLNQNSFRCTWLGLPEELKVYVQFNSVN